MSLLAKPAFSAMQSESDFAPFKPRCDVLLNGSAYAPDGQPAKRVEVGLRVGSMNKTFEVIGNRTWERSLGLITSTPPEPFVKMPISYDNRFRRCRPEPLRRKETQRLH